MKRQLKPFVVERKRRLPAAGQPVSIWSDVMTPELRTFARKTHDPAALADNEAGAEVRSAQAPSNAQPAHRTGRILVSRIDPAPVLTEQLEPMFSDEPRSYRRRSSARRLPDTHSLDVTAIPPETANVVTEAVDVRSDAISIEAPMTSSNTIAKVPYRVRRREATKGLKLEDRWKRGLILRD
ncbi:hypothetical protein [Aureimonas sp. AU12]|uniref:hypothetical protein n=1 Tax=Aureimonas sp. AU12 TaxID=1638161 RepID=UPI00078570A4|nr:hypothetical protein [Aureimonas sp. AU12]